MCRICVEIQMGRMSIADGEMALIEMKPTLDKEHVDIIRKMLDTRKKLESESAVSGESSVGPDYSFEIDIDDWYPLNGWVRGED